jgi:tight adherence protein B
LRPAARPAGPCASWPAGAPQHSQAPSACGLQREGRAATWLARLAPRASLPRVAAAVGAGVGATALLRTPVAGLLVLLAAWGADRWKHRHAKKQAADARAAAVVELCMVMAAELTAGRTPQEALRWAGDVDSDLGKTISGAVKYDHDVPAVLRRTASHPGAESLARLAACWQVSASSGAGLARAVDRLAHTLQAEEAQRRELAAQLAGPRATARLLAVLPAFGLLLGAGLGADPLHVLLATPYGLACLTVGLTLNVAGVLWTERIAHAAEYGT